MPMASSHHFTLLAKFQLVWRRLSEALLSSFSLARQKHLFLLSRLCLTYVGDIKIVLPCPWRSNRRLNLRRDSYTRTLNTTTVEGPIVRHKSRLASRETDDGLTRTYSGESLDRTESVAKRSRERRAHPGRGEAPGREKAVSSSSLTHLPCAEI